MSYIAKDDLELPVLLPPLSGITNVHYQAWFMLC